MRARRWRFVVALLVASITTASILLLSQESRASGQYNHVHMADTAIDEIQDDELRALVRQHLQLYKFASLFPDAFHPVQGSIHTPEFFDAYSRSIHNECFAEPIGSFCGRVPDGGEPIECSPLLNQCRVAGGRVCSNDLSSPCQVNSDCPGLSNRCRDQGVCSDDYTTACVMGINQCPGVLNRCTERYGFCRTNNIGPKCERLIVHFMGALSHLVADVNNDKFLVRSIEERADCPSQILGESFENAQVYTDQEMDGYLGRSATIGNRSTPLHEFLPTSRLAARATVEDNFLDEILLATRDKRGQTGLEFGEDGYQEGDISGTLGPFLGLLDAQWLSVGRKTDESGQVFDTFLCANQPSDDDCNEADLFQRERCEQCTPIFNRCDVEAEGGQDGVCQADYKTRCSTEDGPFENGCSGLFNRCVDSYGRCELKPVRRTPNEGLCQWAIDEDRWHTQGGGTLDTAHEIASLIDQSWELMREGKKLRYRMEGAFADRHLCVGEGGGPDCLSAKATEVIGSDGGGVGSLPGTLSDLSEARKVEQIIVESGTGRLRFRLEGKALDPQGVAAQVDCGSGRDLYLNLAADRQETRKIADTLFAAFMRDLRVQLRTELKACSEVERGREGDRGLLVKEVRFERLVSEFSADAGADQLLQCVGLQIERAAVRLDASGSSDPDGNLLSFAWTAPGIRFDDATSATPIGSFPKGTTTATVAVSNGNETKNAQVDIRIVDTGCDLTGSDPVALVVSNIVPQEQFAADVAIAGETILIGAPGDDANGSGSGSARVQRYDGAAWVEEATLFAADAAQNDLFGSAVAVADGVALVGAPGDADSGSSSGAAYVFRYDGEIWLQEAKLSASDGAAGDVFGSAVSVAGDTALVGAYLDDDGGSGSGSTYVFRYDGKGWVEEAKLTASDGVFGDQFGFSVALSGSTAVVGARRADPTGSDSGAAYVFRYEGETWTQETKLTAADGSRGDSFGNSVAVSDDAVLVGALRDAAFAGSAYVFRYDGKTWHQEAKLRASDGNAGDQFGTSVALIENTAVVSAQLDGDSGSASGAAYIFLYDGTAWREMPKLRAPDGRDLGGSMIAVTADTVLIGASPFDVDSSGFGVAYLFAIPVPEPTAWMLHAMAIAALAASRRWPPHRTGRLRAH